MSEVNDGLLQQTGPITIHTQQRPNDGVYGVTISNGVYPVMVSQGVTINCFQCVRVWYRE